MGRSENGSRVGASPRSGTVQEAEHPRRSEGWGACHVRQPCPPSAVVRWSAAGPRQQKQKGRPEAALDILYRDSLWCLITKEKREGIPDVA
jgi:hypothetical protein